MHEIKQTDNLNSLKYAINCNTKFRKILNAPWKTSFKIFRPQSELEKSMIIYRISKL